MNVWALGGATAVLVAIFAWIPYVWAEDTAPHSPTVVSISHIAAGLSHPTVRAALIVATILAALILLLRRTVVLAAVALVIVGWSLTGEVNASNKSLDVGRNLIASQPRPLDWIDRATHGAPAVYVGQAKLRGPEILSLGFWNDSLDRLVTLGGETVYGLIFKTKIASREGRLSDPRLARLRRVGRGGGGRETASRAQEALESPARRRTGARERLRGRHLAGRLEGGAERIYPLRPPGGPSGQMRVGLSQKWGCDPASHPLAMIRVVELARQRVTSRPARRAPRVPEASG